MTLIPYFFCSWSKIRNFSNNKSGAGFGFVFSAVKTNFYTVTFYHNNDSTVVETTDGHAAHTYLATGTYSIKTCAHTTYTDFIQKVENVAVTVTGGSTSGAPTTGYSTPNSYANYSLVWSDEFNGSSLSSDWTFDIGTGSGGWGNNELQYYTNQNYTLNGGYLEITAKNQPFNSQLYTSTRMKTQGIKSWKYGRIDIRAAIPYGQGIWPALWMLGADFATVGWPNCGEIDIMEHVGNNQDNVLATLHFPGNSGGNGVTGSTTVTGASTDFHIYKLLWTPQSLKFYVDDVLFHSMANTNSIPFNVGTPSILF